MGLIETQMGVRVERADAERREVVVAAQIAALEEQLARTSISAVATAAKAEATVDAAKGGAASARNS